MKDLLIFGQSPQHEGETIGFLHGLIFEVLLITDGRTTDILETLLNEKMTVKVIRQERMNKEHVKLLSESSDAPYYFRESILVSEKSQFIVSHNFAVVNSKHVPDSLFEKIAIQQEGIGKTINSVGIHSFRKVVDRGLKNEDEAVDLFQKPIKLSFSKLHSKIPYKRYSINFGHAPGIQMLEYFNPEIVIHRMSQDKEKK